MHKKLLIALLLTFPVLAAQAQSTPAKKALVARILKAQQPGIEGMGRAMAERPAMVMLDSAGAALQERVAADKRDAVGKEIQNDVKKYLDEAGPLVSSRGVKLAPSTVGPLLEEKFSEEELKQIAAFLESPAVNKFQQLSGEMQKILLEKLLSDTRVSIEPKLAALEQSIGRRLNSATSGAVK